MSVELLDDKRITEFIYSGLQDICKDSNLMTGFIQVLTNPQLYSHSIDTARFAMQIACVYDSNIDLLMVSKAGLLHDIGKVEIPVEILNKPGRLNDYEMSIMQTHPEKGYEILKKLGVDLELADTALNHHEKLSGNGYPRHTTHIAKIVQMITVADIFSALTELRSYKQPMHSNKAFEIMRGMDGLNQEFVDLLESRVIDEIDDYNARQLAKFYQRCIAIFDKVYEDLGGELEYSI